jgi:glycosyltransferase involved in cell wall biosynthesis
MKIAININELTLKQNTGVKVYTREIVNALSKIDNENEYVLYASENVKSCVSTADNFKFNPEFSGQNSKFNKILWTYTKFPQEIKKDRPDILFMPIQSVPFWKRPKNIKIVVTVHDLAFMIFPDHFTAKDRFLLKFHTKRAVEMSDKIIVPSEATKSDLVRFYGVSEDKVGVIRHGVANNLKFKTSSLKLNKGAELLIGSSAPLFKNQPYILFVGAIQPRKNIIRLIEAFEKIKNENFLNRSKTTPIPQGMGVENKESSCRKEISNLRLVICGMRGWMANKTYKRAKESKFSKDIIFTGSVNDCELAQLYKNALMFVLPSLYEGFGLPVLEAMNFGIPCIVSDNSSLGEIAGDSALLINAYDSNDIAEKINMFLASKELRKDFSQRSVENAKKFDWVESARKTLEVFNSI